ncbi:sulfite oxidase [Streptomyces clavuligerus]|uniref:Putative sulfite oxidase n=1 Tax=Streptomyces clavuligerus TaxID=1901 RepID=E2PX83_STRCL|nr:sulfite oxidase [Streptomyces clavuligerus]ANW17363.1 sulfite oxidase [Streptomyces clavuligerus]AXU11913.1 sulfite oxidase [Streptomyces clavuligerus]EFG10160.1 Putative sulfite oxidase [Streptomyces clavuligerus]MBY6301755.1 sulfite oxidase [Streptomyces clavuligerus]QCS04693.1 sulfite oxidase [Streptomyces clavuligerus]
MSSASGRRDLLRWLAAAPLAASVLGAGPPAWGRARGGRLPGVEKPLPDDAFTVRGTNAETRFPAFRGTGALTPRSLFFVRNHTRTPVLDERDWRLTLWGSGLRGRHPVHIGYGQLRSMPSVTLTAVIECAGNGRSLFTTQQGEQVSGTPWTMGAIGAARWRGVRLRDVLYRAGLAGSAVDVMPRGLDDEFTADGVSLGRVRRPLPVAKALDDVILAYEMNGEPLPYDHGFPVRVVVPSWIGIASVKWVGDIEVSDAPLASPWNTRFYRLFGPDHPPGGSAPLTRQTIKSALELPWDATLAAGERTRLTGRAWSAAAPVRGVEVSTDGGTRWRPARLHDVPRRHGWVRWSADWVPPRPGPVTLLSRATDRHGNVQPARAAHNTQGYLFDAVVRHPVTVV